MPLMPLPRPSPRKRQGNRLWNTPSACRHLPHKGGESKALAFPVLLAVEGAAGKSLPLVGRELGRGFKP